MEFIQQNLLLVILTVTSGAMLFATSFFGGGPRLTTVEATNLINREDAQVIDVREQPEWAKGRIAGSRHIPVGQLDQRIGDLEKFKERPLIVVCASGMRSASACSTLRKAGFEKVFALDGGIGAWEQAGLPLTKK